MRDIDFLPEKIRDQRARRRSLFRQGQLTAVCLVAIVILGLVRQHGIGKAQAELTRVRNQAANVRYQLTFRSMLEKQKAELMIKKRIDDQLGSRVNALEVLAELEHMLPESIFLSTLTLEAVEERVALTSAVNRSSSGKAVKRLPAEQSIKRVRLRFIGVAPGDVALADFVAQLSAGRLFEEVSLRYAKDATFGQRTVREFEANCYVVR